jgi:hypothetical protein
LQVGPARSASCKHPINSAAGRLASEQACNNGAELRRARLRTFILTG